MTPDANDPPGTATTRDRRRAPFRQIDVKRAVRAAHDCGLAVIRTEIGTDGRIVLVHALPDAAPATPFDRWKARHAG